MLADLLSSPRPELLALLDAVKDNPDDDTPRLILADWLDEQDNALDAERAAFIRKAIAEHRTGRSVSLLTEADHSAREAFLQRWLGSVAGIASSCRFDRGLPVLFATGPQFLKPDVPALLASEAFAFVQFVRLDEAGGPRMAAMAELPAFRYVTGLSVYPFSPLGVHYASKFFGSPNLTGLRQIEFYGVKPGAAGMEVLANNPALARLQKLTLAHNKLVDKAVTMLTPSPYLTNLTHLNLSDNNIGDKGAEALAASTTFANLRELHLGDNSRLTERGKQLLRDTFGDRVRLD